MTEKKEKSSKKSKKETVLVFGAHSDDFVIGAGGTLKKYVDEGKQVINIIFSYGEMSHPWLRKKKTIEMRVKETVEATKFLGIQESSFLGLKEGQFEADGKKKKIIEHLVKIIKEKKPAKIFTHSADDPHLDHLAVYRMTLEILEKTKYKGDVYTYNIWNPLRIKHREHPKLFVDITETFAKKITAFKMFHSQALAMMQFLPQIYFRNFIAGVQNKCRYAEIFIKIK